MQTKLILIRHGETFANRQKRYIGITESRITSYGKYQARCLQKRISTGVIDKIFASSSGRAVDFAKIIFAKKQIQTLSELREMNFGIFEGLTFSQVTRKYPQIYDKWLKNPQRFGVPRAESFVDFKARIYKVFKKIISNNAGKTVAVVTHGGPIRLILSRFLKTKNLWATMPALASVSIIRFKDAEAKILKINDTSHYR